MSRSRTWLGVSAAALVVAIVGIAVNGLNLGLESPSADSCSTRRTSRSRPIKPARRSRTPASTAVVQEADGGQIAVRTGEISNEDEVTIREALADESAGATKERDELIGPSLGDELRQRALIAFGIALLVQMLYLAVRSKWTIGASAVLAAVLGGDSLRDFALALLLGLGVGTYSSIFTATPISLLLHQRWPMPKAAPARSAQRVETLRIRVRCSD